MHIDLHKIKLDILVRESYEGRLATQEIIGNAQVGTGGLGLRPQKKQSLKDKRRELVKLMKEDAEHQRIVDLGQYEMQAKWLSVGIDNMQRKDLTWNKILYQCSDRLLKFIVNAIPDWLPSPDNLRRWNRVGIHRCGLWGKINATLAHILCGCPWVREVENKSGREDRYTWRHNCILAILAEAIKKKLSYINSLPPANTKPVPVPFVRAGEKKSVVSQQRQRRAPTGLLSHARDWEADFDLPEYRTNGSVFAFPYDVCATPLRIDAYLISRTSKICIAGPELTAPMEENIHFWNKTKRDKYQVLRFPETKGWCVHELILEVGWRGFIPPSFRNALKKLNFDSGEIRHLENECSLMSQRCSYVIYLHRFNKMFLPRRLQPSLPSSHPQHSPILTRSKSQDR